MDDSVLFPELDTDSNAENSTVLEEKEPSNPLFSNMTNSSEDVIELQTKVNPDPNKNGNGILNDQINALTEERDRLFVEADKYKKLSASYIDSLSAIEGKMRLLEDSKMVLEAKNKEKDLQIEEFDRIKEEAQTHITKLSAIAKSNKEAFEKASAQIIELRNSSNVSEEMNEQYLQKEKDLADCQIELSTLQDEHELLDAEFKELGVKFERLNEAHNSLVQEFDNLKEHSDTLQKIIDDMSMTSDVSVEHNDALSALQLEVEELRLKLATSLTETEQKSTNALISADKLRKIEETIVINRQRYNELEQSFKERETAFYLKEEELNSKINEMKESLNELTLQNSNLQTNLESVEIELKFSKSELDVSVKEKEEVTLALNERDKLNTELGVKVSALREDYQSILLEKDKMQSTIDSIIKSPLFLSSNVRLDDFKDGIPSEVEHLLASTSIVDDSEMENMQSKLDSANSLLKEKEEELVQSNNHKDLLTKELNDLKSMQSSSESNQSEIEMKLLEAQRNSLELEKQNAELQNLVNSLTEQLEERTEQTQEEMVTTAIVQNSVELDNAKLRILELEGLLKDARDKVKNRDERISGYKENEIEFRDTITELKKSLTELKKSKGDPNAVENFTKEVFDLTPEELFQKFNEFSVTLEVANYNLGVMNDFPKAKAIVTSKVEENKSKLAGILTKKYPYSK